MFEKEIFLCGCECADVNVKAAVGVEDMFVCWVKSVVRRNA